MASFVGEEWEASLRLLRVLEGGALSGSAGKTRFEVVDRAMEVMEGVTVLLPDLGAFGVFDSSSSTTMSCYVGSSYER